MDKREFISLSIAGITGALFATPTKVLSSFAGEEQTPGNNHLKQGTMTIQQIRNATLVIHYAGKKFLIDPMLSEQGGDATYA